MSILTISSRENVNSLQAELERVKVLKSIIQDDKITLNERKTRIKELEKKLTKNKTTNEYLIFVIIILVIAGWIKILF